VRSASAESRQLGRCGQPRRDRGLSLAPQRAQVSRLARSGGERSGAPHGVLGLDNKPPGAILPDVLGGMACTSQRTTGERRGRHNAASSFICPPDGRTPSGGQTTTVGLRKVNGVP
jgi:hypothetical protein